MTCGVNRIDWQVHWVQIMGGAQGRKGNRRYFIGIWWLCQYGARWCHGIVSFICACYLCRTRTRDKAVHGAPSMWNGMSMGSLLISCLRFHCHPSRSENTPVGWKTSKINQILLNGNNVCMVRRFRSSIRLDRYNECRLIIHSPHARPHSLSPWLAYSWWRVRRCLVHNQSVLIPSLHGCACS